MTGSFLLWVFAKIHDQKSITVTFLPRISKNFPILSWIYGQNRQKSMTQPFLRHRFFSSKFHDRWLFPHTKIEKPFISFLAVASFSFLKSKFLFSNFLAYFSICVCKFDYFRFFIFTFDYLEFFVLSWNEKQNFPMFCIFPPKCCVISKNFREISRNFQEFFNFRSTFLEFSKKFSIL